MYAVVHFVRSAKIYHTLWIKSNDGIVVGVDIAADVVHNSICHVFNFSVNMSGKMGERMHSDEISVVGPVVPA